MVLTLLRVVSPSTASERNWNTGWRTAQASASTAKPSPASANSALPAACSKRRSVPGETVAAAFMARSGRRSGLGGVVQRGAGQQAQAEAVVGDAGRAGGHGHQRVPGHARRGVHLEQEGLTVAGADHQVGAAPATAAERAVGLQHDALDLAL